MIVKCELVIEYIDINNPDLIGELLTKVNTRILDANYIGSLDKSLQLDYWSNWLKNNPLPRDAVYISVYGLVLEQVCNNRKDTDDKDGEDDFPFFINTVPKPNPFIQQFNFLKKYYNE